MSVVPAHIARLADQGRPLTVGEPANLTLVDPAARAVVDRDASASLARNNPWHGRELPDPRRHHHLGRPDHLLPYLAAPIAGNALGVSDSHVYMGIPHCTQETSWVQRQESGYSGRVKAPSERPERFDIGGQQAIVSRPERGP